MRVSHFASLRDWEQSPAKSQAGHIVAATLYYAVVMTLHSKIWAIGTLALFFPLGAIVMIGVIPGAGSDFEAARGFAISTRYLVEQYGAFFTGVFYMLVGCVLSAVFLVWGDFLRHSGGGDGSGAVGDCGDGGD